LFAGNEQNQQLLLEYKFSFIKGTKSNPAYIHILIAGVEQPERLIPLCRRFGLVDFNFWKVIGLWVNFSSPPNLSIQV